jgi:transmembrane sensor
MTKRETSAEIDAAAADWAVRVDGGPLDTQGQAALDRWLAGDSRRLGAYARARAVLTHGRRIKALGTEFDPDRYADDHETIAERDLDSGVVPIAPAGDAPTELPSSRRRFLALGGVAAAAAAIGAIGLSWPAAAHTYRTEKGEIRLVPLEDGSSITLNTSSEVRVRYESHERHVELVAGEALFDVAHDSRRPFLVDAGDTKVKAVGTSFTVRRLGAHPVEVLVRQGVVEIVRPAAPQASPTRIDANVRAVAAPAAPIVETRLPPGTVSRELAWREGMLSFEDMPLRDAAAEFARYSDVRIGFADASIEGETVTGLYAANNPRGFARSVALSLGLRVSDRPDGVTLER